ncbi:hypothetical protein [Halochromatium salexigens]|uniref:Uncharacterized protein n=1 Tax=Halochromatium salexigens TaxID=49447 RepID=A0AAJ0UIL3_HALSE|nr:hypothetical protein [Halochromatium salexigens]MBK5932154.1 hypothetical protein [Halochromatium salexigens]
MSSEATTSAAAASAKPKNKEPYQQAYYPPVPTGFTRYMRTSLLWQFWRFIVINLKMFKLMFSSHH